jgi:hypothetical protein
LQKPDLVALRIVLYENLEESFDFRKFDYRLVRNDGIPTLLGIWFDNPNNSILTYVDKVIINIRDTLKRIPTIKRLEAKAIAEKINTKPEIVEMCFDLIFSIGGFASSDSSSSGKPGFEVLEIDNIDVVTNYLYYKDLDSIWKRFTEKPIKKLMKSYQAIQRCTGIISTEVLFENNEIHWKCSKCRNEGTITGW